MSTKILIIGGPTASGKSQLALNLAKEFPAVIINADSMQVYKEIPIITAQPDTKETHNIDHVLYGFLPAKVNCSVAMWLDHATKEIDQAKKQKKTPIVVGGTGLYIKCLMHGISTIPDIEDELREKARGLLAQIGNEEFHKMLKNRDPIAAEKLYPGDSQRMLRAFEVIEQTGKSIYEWQESPDKTFYPQESFKGFFLNPEREILYEHCNKRFVKMLEAGALEEVKALNDLALEAELPAMKALGVPELISYLNKERTLEEATAEAQMNTRRYAKRQITWFKHQLPELEEISEIEPATIA